MLQRNDENNKFGYRDMALATMMIQQDAYSCYAEVRSESDACTYRVNIDEKEHKASSCTCIGYSYAKCCKHITIVNLYYLRIVGMFAHTDSEEETPIVAEPTPDEVAAQAEEANMQKLAEYRKQAESNLTHCGGCGCVYGEGVRCQPGQPAFCFWNSFWTEARRQEEDERVRMRDELQKIRVHNHFSWRVA